MISFALYCLDHLSAAGPHYTALSPAITLTKQYVLLVVRSTYGRGVTIRRHPFGHTLSKHLLLHCFSLIYFIKS